ncbi:MAG: WD40 repeat domain-containing protein, partial [Gemmataceae bacterium]
SSLQFTPDGQYLLAGGRASNLYVWEVGTGAQVLTGRSPPSGFAADGRRFAGGDGSRVSICTLLTPQALRDLSGHRASPTRLAWSGDSRRLASLDFRSEVRVWDVDRGLPLGAFDVPRGTFYSPNAAIALSDDGSLLGYASGGKDAVAVLADASTGKELDRWPLPTGFERMVYAGGRFLLLREEETHAGKFDWQTVAREFGPDHSPADSMRIVRPAVAGEVDFHTSGLTADGRFYWWIGPRRPPANMRAEVREIATGRLVKSVPIPQVQEAQTWDGFVTPDGGELWLIGQGGWTAHDLTGARPSEPRAPGPFGWALGSGWELVSNLSQEMRGTPALTIRRAGGPMWLELMSRDLAGISGACFSPDGRRAAWGSGHSTVSIIDLPLLQREVGEFERLLPQ